jgi:DNA polymerase type B, organellar and viral
MVRTRLTPRDGTGLSRGQTTQARKILLQDRPFIAWDGEGVNLKGAGKPQSYVLFGSSVGHISSRTGLSAFDCLDHILETGAANPGAVHVGFAFTYDANMIIRSLSPSTLGRLHRNGWVRLKRRDGRTYTVTFAKGKFFRVTLHKPGYDPKQNPHAKITVQIFDIFSFFMSSFIKAYESMVGPVSTLIREGKAGRAEFKIEEFAEILAYWSDEIQMLRELASELRRRVYNAGLRISQWHGPGALASYALKQHKIRRYMNDTGSDIRLAARYAYAGGRFECYKLGRVLGPVYGLDINSAYPYAIAQLPSLTDGTWTYVSTPQKIRKFGVYRVALKRGAGFVSKPSPVFHRDKNHNITFPWVTDGWYWSPEAYHAQKCGATIVEGWEYTGWSELPFAWVADMYAQRRDWKLRGIAAQVALKLCMNSMYGKLAQRIGWDPISQNGLVG